MRRITIWRWRHHVASSIATASHHMRRRVTHIRLVSRWVHIPSIARRTSIAIIGVMAICTISSISSMFFWPFKSFSLIDRKVLYCVSEISVGDHRIFVQKQRYLNSFFPQEVFSAAKLLFGSFSAVDVVIGEEKIGSHLIVG